MFSAIRSVFRTSPGSCGSRVVLGTSDECSRVGHNLQSRSRRDSQLCLHCHSFVLRACTRPRTSPCRGQLLADLRDTN